MDTTTTIADLKELIAQFIADRDWEKFHASKNLAMSIAIEAAELMEHFQWQENGAGQVLLDDPAKKTEIGEELADILIYTIRTAERLDIDLIAAANRKIEINESRYPTQKVYGDARRADEYPDDQS